MILKRDEVKGMRPANKRINEIVRILLEEENYITISKISDMLDVSNKTVRNDLLQLDKTLKSSGLELVKKTGVGIRIYGSEKDKLKILNRVNKKNKSQHAYSPRSRRNIIGMQLCIYNECSIHDLSELLFVSRPTIYSDMTELNKYVSGFKVEIIRNSSHGLLLEGKEKNIRNFLFDMCLNDCGYYTFIDMIQNPDYECKGNFVFYGLEVTDDEIKDFVDCILTSNLPYLQGLSFQSLVMLMLRLFCTYIRISDRKEVQLSKKFLEELGNRPLYEEARFVSDRIANHFKLEYSKVEIRYIQIYLLSLRNKEYLYSNNERIVKYYTKQLIDSWANQLCLPLNQNDELYEGVFEHLKPVFIRLRHGITHVNPYLAEIRESFANTYEIVKKSVKGLETYFSCELPNDEIGYLTLHLSSALEQMRIPLQTILVSHSGGGVAKMIQIKLESQINEIEIISVENFFSINNHNFEGVDLIISTMPIKTSKAIPVLEIPTIPQEYDINRLKKTVRTLYKRKNDPGKSNKNNDSNQKQL